MSRLSVTSLVELTGIVTHEKQRVQNGHKPKRPNDMVTTSANMWTNNLPLPKPELLGQAMKPGHK